MGLDKITHLLAGTVITLGSGIALLKFFPLDLSMILALTLCVVVASLKELRDSYGYGTPEKADFLWTLLGGVLGVLWVALFNTL